MHNIKKEFEALATTLKFQFGETELDKIVQEYMIINHNFSLIKAFDTTDILPMNFIHPISNGDYLREDIAMNASPQEVFSNCKGFKQDMVIIKNETK